MYIKIAKKPKKLPAQLETLLGEFRKTKRGRAFQKNPFYVN